jgi:hypothetical protein
MVFEGPPPKIYTRTAESAISMGNLVRVGTTYPETGCIEIPALPAADDNALITVAQGASALVPVNYDTAAEFDGAIGVGLISPARVVTIECSANADWDTPTGMCRFDVYGPMFPGGPIVKDTVVRPNQGAVLFQGSTRIPFSGVVQIDQEACNGATGTMIAGVDNDRVGFGIAQYPGVACYNPASEPFTAAREIETADDVNIIVRGSVVVHVEHTVVAGEQAYVRHTAAGAVLAGRWTGNAAAVIPGTYAMVQNAYFVRGAVADGLAVVMLGGRS